ncbi:hypothetical protein EVAR_97512_1 [Eumeta japonica]|uniref:Uncharacterized protein n=1 Tax=Eumeta variegata TaxID=151549 RepID=A0A4C1WNG4_EUMVA|nr:hypothetical protein EVAR_97512_1 [Eumeta japonica]
MIYIIITSDIKLRILSLTTHDDVYVRDLWDAGRMINQLELKLRPFVGPNQREEEGDVFPVRIKVLLYYHHVVVSFSCFIYCLTMAWIAFSRYQAIENANTKQWKKNGKEKGRYHGRSGLVSLIAGAPSSFLRLGPKS